MNPNAQNIANVIAKLPHSVYRVPHTYCYDFLRTKTKTYKGMSRPEVAQKSNLSIPEQYALSLVYLLDELGGNALPYLDAKDFELCKQVVEQSNDLLHQLH